VVCSFISIAPNTSCVLPAHMGYVHQVRSASAGAGAGSSAGSSHRPPPLPTPVPRAPAVAFTFATPLPALTDITPTTLATFLAAVSGPVVLEDPDLQVRALTSLGALLPRKNPSTATELARCAAVAACTQWVCDVVEAHPSRTDIVERAMFVLRRIGRDAATHSHPTMATTLMDAVPLVVRVLSSTRSPACAEHCLWYLGNLLCRRDNNEPLMAHLGLVQRVIGAHLSNDGVADAGLLFLHNLCVDPDLRRRLQDAGVARLAAEARAAHGSHDDIAWKSQVVLDRLGGVGSPDAGPSHRPPPLPTPVPRAPAVAFTFATPLPALTDITPTTLATFLAAVSGPVVLEDPDLQVRALTSLGALLPRKNPSTATELARCAAVAACTQWVCDVVEAHPSRTDIVERAMFVLRRIGRDAATHSRPTMATTLMDAVPLVVRVLSSTRSPACAEHCLWYLGNLLCRGDNKEPLMAHLGLVQRVIGAHLSNDGVADAGLLFLHNLCVDPDLRRRLQAAGVARLAAEARAAHGSHDDISRRSQVVLDILGAPECIPP
jgi:hypothetical protein